MYTKKIVALLLALLMIAALVGCKPASEPAPAPVTSPETETEQEKEPETDKGTEPETSEAPELFNTPGVLTVAMSPDFAPLEFCDTSKSGQDMFVGFDPMLAKYIADELGVTLEIKPMDFTACQTAIQLGAVDMGISGFSWMPERAENFLISDYYIAGENETEQVIITIKEKEGTFTKAEDFAGLKIGAQAASLQEHLCKDQLPEDIQLELFKDLADAVLALQTGKIDALAAADGHAQATMANNPNVALSGYAFHVEPLYQNNVILLNKSDEALLAKVNEVLAKAMAAGLYDGWYTEAQKLAGIDTAEEISYDEEGKPVA